MTREATISAWVEFEPARDPDHQLLEPGRLEPLRQALHLDVVGLVAIVGQHRRVGGDERETLDPAAQLQPAGRRGPCEIDPAKRRRCREGEPGAIAEGVGAHALLTDAAEIDIGDRDLRAGAEPLGFGQVLADLEDAGLAVPGEIGRRLAGTGRGIGIGGDAARRLRGAQEAPHLRLADDDIAGRQVEQYLGAGRRASRARRRRHPQILANLDMKRETSRAAGGKQQIDAERRHVPGHRDRAVAHALARGEMAPLVEFAVVRQEHLRHHPEQLPAMDDEAAIVEMPPGAQRRADDEQRRQLFAGGNQPVDLGGHGIEHGILKQQIVDRIGRQAQLRKHHQRDACLVGGGDEIERLIGVLRRLGDRDLRHAGADPHELVAIGREKIGHRIRRSRVLSYHCNLGSEAPDGK